jgi:hypothetical protein
MWSTVQHPGSMAADDVIRAIRSSPVWINSDQLEG